MTNPRNLLRAAATLALFALLSPLATLAASTLNGTVTNGTTKKPSAGDDVVLLQMMQGLTEAGRTRTDAKGHFSLSIPDDNPHLIRVEHQKGSYFRQAPPGTQSVEITVYDVAAKVEGISTVANVFRLEADNSGLKVTENFFIKNASSPPRTQFSDHSYEIYLPVDAQIDGSAAMTPGGLPVSSSPVPLGDKGHYAFAFPIRPAEPGAQGTETRFQLSYRIPYNGSYKFTVRESLPTDNVAVMLPKSMKFAGAAAFQPVNDEVQAQTFLARAVAPGQTLEFTVSGTGSMPREAQADGGQSGAPGGPAAGQEGPGQTVGAPGAASSDNRPGGGLGTPIASPDPLTKYRWWILGGLSIVLACAAAFLLRNPPATTKAPGTPVLSAPTAAPERAWAPPPPPFSPPPPFGGYEPPAPPASSSDAMLAALKEELFALETERLQGKVSDSEYAELKSAFETVLRRTLARKN